MIVREQFQWHLVKHCEETGFEPPVLLLEYLVDLLAAKLTDTDIIPHPSFAERYLQLYSTKQVSEIKDYADQCLFFVSIMPDYGLRRGLNMDYYATLGISSYYAYGDIVSDNRFIQLGNWFYHLQKFLNSAITPTNRLEFFNL
jgi:hypothetical protein